MQRQHFFNTQTVNSANKTFIEATGFSKQFAKKFTNIAIAFHTGTTKLLSTARDITDTAGNTGKISDSLSGAEEDLKYIRDLAEQETIKHLVLN